MELEQLCDLSRGEQRHFVSVHDYRQLKCMSRWKLASDVYEFS
jgi:hypothetical protein